MKLIWMYSVCGLAMFRLCLAGYHHDVAWVAQHLSTRSPYPTDQVPKKDLIVDDYIVDQLQLVVRHGTRYPEADDMQDINDAIQLLSTSSNKSAVGWLEAYDNPYLMRREGMLDGNGQLEQYLHGRRVAKSYPELIKAVVDGDVLHMSAFSSWSHRTSESGDAFCLGVFEGYGTLGPSKQMSVSFLSYAKHNDSLIAFHENCPRWKKDVVDANVPDQETEPWKKHMLKPIAERLSKDLGVNVSVSDLKKIHNGCAYDVAQHQEVGTFCSLFNHDDLLKMEYLDDLKTYYKYSYGYESLNGKLACRLVQVLMEDIEHAVHNKTSHYRFTIKFGHSETIIPLQTFLGLHKDHPKLHAGSTADQIEHRKFRGAKFDTFAGSVTFQVLTKKGTADKYIRVLVSEEPVILPGCDEEVCPYKQFRSMMEPLLKCNFEEICSLH